MVRKLLEMYLASYVCTNSRWRENIQMVSLTEATNGPLHMIPITKLVQVNFSPVDRHEIQRTKSKWWNINCIVGGCGSFVDSCSSTNKANSQQCHFLPLN